MVTLFINYPTCQSPLRALAQLATSNGGSRYSFEDRESPPMQEDLNRQLLRRSLSGREAAKQAFHRHVSESPRPPPSALIQVRNWERQYRILRTHRH